MTDKEKIRKEVARIQLYTQSGVLKQILDFIDSLQEEPVNEELEEEVQRILDEHFYYPEEGDELMDTPNLVMYVARHFAQWQKEQMKEALRTEYEKGRHDALEEMKKSKQC